GTSLALLTARDGHPIERRGCGERQGGRIERSRWGSQRSRCNNHLHEEGKRDEEADGGGNGRERSVLLRLRAHGRRAVCVPGRGDEGEGDAGPEERGEGAGHPGAAHAGWRASGSPGSAWSGSAGSAWPGSSGSAWSGSPGSAWSGSSGSARSGSSGSSRPGSPGSADDGRCEAACRHEQGLFVGERGRGRVQGG